MSENPITDGLYVSVSTAAKLTGLTVHYFYKLCDRTPGERQWSGWRVSRPRTIRKGVHTFINLADLQRLVDERTEELRSRLVAMGHEVIINEADLLQRARQYPILEMSEEEK